MNSDLGGKLREWNEFCSDSAVYTELASRREQFHVAPAMQQLNSADSAPLR